MRRDHLALVLLVAVLGVATRMVVATAGYGQDLSSYRLVLEIAEQGGNVYAETWRYNYGPVWLKLLGLLDGLPGIHPDPLVSLRLKVSAFLALVDVALALLLLRRFGAVAACLVLLNPISIVVSGFQGQFDNLAVVVGLAAILCLERGDEPEDLRWKGAGLVLLGLSLAIKHVLFALPLWLAFRERRWGDRVAVVAIPVAVFLAGFIPYLGDGGQGIVRHVFLYRSEGTGPLWSHLPGSVLERVPAVALFLGTMVAAGWLWRRSGPPELLLRYLALVVVSASAFAVQYLAIPVVTLAASRNWLYALYTLAGGAYVAHSYDGRLLAAFAGGAVMPGADLLLRADVLTGLLGAGLLWQVWRGTAWERRK